MPAVNFTTDDNIFKATFNPRFNSAIPTAAPTNRIKSLSFEAKRLDR